MNVATAQEYLTGLLVGGPDEYVTFPISAATWRAELVAGTQRGSIHHYDNSDGTVIGGFDREIALLARSLPQAERALSMISSALIVVQGSDTFAIDLKLSTRGEAMAMRKKNPMHGLARLPGSAEATFLAASASRRLAQSYAIAKLSLSMGLHSTHVMDLNPATCPALPKSDDPVVHTRLAHAIVLAYGAIEEMGLEVRASQKQPSVKNGAWNPPVLADLEHRLRAAGVDPYDKLIWDVRGPRTRLEQARPPQAHSRAPWTRWPDIRDVKVTVVDAIAHTSWLRSKVTAHAGNKDLVRVLSAYDVANAQQVARYLLLTRHGILQRWFPSRSSPKARKSTRRSAR